MLVVSADPYNRSSLRTVTVGGLPQDSVVNVTQVATIDRDTLEERIGALPDWLLTQVEAGLRRALGPSHL